VAARAPYAAAVAPSPDDPLVAFATGPAAYVFAFLLGALFGSFANVCIARLPRGMSIVRPPSHCFACNAPVAWYDNIPIVSYLVLRGRCRRCGAAYSARYMFVEAATGLLFVATYHLSVNLLFWYEPVPHRLARFCVYALYELTLVVITFIDLDEKKILDVITYPAIPVFFGLGQLIGDLSWKDALAGVVVGYGVVRAIADGYYYLTKREGMGYGDGKLLAIIGALFGWRAVVFSLFGGSLLGSVIGVGAIVIARRRARPEGAEPEAPLRRGAQAPLRQVELPFGPFLVAAALTYLFLQDQVRVGLRLFWPA
jgi:leader peptidase (prepilin peptidase)/N-methyltransferase